MPVLYTNNAASALSASITNTATSFSVTAGHGARFPAISGGDHFYATLIDTAGNIEIVRVTARSTDTFTVTRGQDGTTGRAFSAGDRVELRLTKLMLDDFKTDTRSGYLPLVGGTVSGVLSLTGSNATPLEVIRTGSNANANMRFSNTASTTFFGIGAQSGELRVGTTVDIFNSGNIVLHTGNVKTVNGNSIQGSGNIQIDSGVTSFNSRTGAVTLTSGDVTGALGFTPLSLGGGTVTGVTTFSNASDAQIVLNGAGTSWAGITWTDVSGTDYTWFNGSTSTFAIGGGGSAVSGKKLHVHGGMTVGANYAAIGNPTNGLNVEGAIQQAGNQVLHAGNYSSYTFPLGGSWYASGLPGSRAYGIGLSGGEFVIGNGLPNAGQLGVLIDGCYVAGENNGFWSLASDNTWGSRRGFFWDGSNINFNTNSPQVAVTRLTVGGGGASSWINMEDSDEGVRYLHNNSSTIGFVANDGNWSFRVADAGNIWLRNRGWFDDIVIRKDVAQTVGNVIQFQMNRNGRSGNTDTAGLQAYSTGNNSAYMSFHKGGHYAVNMGLDDDNVLRIGGWSASANRFQMDMSGNLTMAGNVTANSDERLKTDWAELPVDFIERLATVKSGTYTRIDSGERQAGSSAQDWRKLLPEVVTTSNDDDKTLALAYGNAALVSAIELAKRLLAAEKEIAVLKELTRGPG